MCAFASTEARRAELKIAISVCIPSSASLISCYTQDLSFVSVLRAGIVGSVRIYTRTSERYKCPLCSPEVEPGEAARRVGVAEGL